MILQHLAPFSRRLFEASHDLPGEPLVRQPDPAEADVPVPPSGNSPSNPRLSRACSGRLSNGHVRSTQIIGAFRRGPRWNLGSISACGMLSMFICGSRCPKISWMRSFNPRVKFSLTVGGGNTLRESDTGCPQETCTTCVPQPSPAWR